MYYLSRLVNDLLFNWYVLYFFYFLLHWHYLDFLFRDYLLIVLSDFLYCVIVLFNDLAWDCLNDFTLCIFDYFSSSGYHLLDGPRLVIHYFLLVRNIFYPACTFHLNKKITLHYRSLLNSWPCQFTDFICCKTARLISVNARPSVCLFVWDWVSRIGWCLVVEWWKRRVDCDIGMFISSNWIFWRWSNAGSFLWHAKKSL